MNQIGVASESAASSSVRCDVDAADAQELSTRCPRSRASHGCHGLANLRCRWRLREAHSPGLQCATRRRPGRTAARAQVEVDMGRRKSEPPTRTRPEERLASAPPLVQACSGRSEVRIRPGRRRYVGRPPHDAARHQWLSVRRRDVKAAAAAFTEVVTSCLPWKSSGGNRVHARSFESNVCPANRALEPVASARQ